MSDNIPFDIQLEIIKKVSHVKSLMQLRSVCKPWKSFIDSYQFINGYGARHTHPYSRILMYQVHWSSQHKYICLVDDEIDTFKVQRQVLSPFVVSPLLKQYFSIKLVGACHGLVCLYGMHKGYNKWMFVIWNPSIGKSFGIVVPRHDHTFTHGFGVCPVTSDPTVVKYYMPWYVEVFTLSSGVWNAIPCSKLLRESIKLVTSTQVVIDGFIYWGAYQMIYSDEDDGKSTTNHMVVSFDLITKEFNIVDLPDTLTKELGSFCKLSKLRGSLVVYRSIYSYEAVCCSVWVMDLDSSFRKLFTIGAPVNKILGFTKNGEAIFETPNKDGRFTTLDVYDPCSQQIKNLGISGENGSFFMGSYKESLLLLDHLDSRIYYDNN